MKHKIDWCARLRDLASGKLTGEIPAIEYALARQFYKMQGCEVPDDYRFYEAHHPMEVGCWNMAVLAYDHIEGTDVVDCLAQLEDV